MVNLLSKKDGQTIASQRVGASINYSPEFNAPEPNLNLLRRLAESGGGRLLSLDNPADSAFLHDRRLTYQPRDLWEWLLKLCVLLFPLDVAVRRIQLDREEMLRAWRKVRSRVIFWRGVPREPEAEESLAALLARREQVRSVHTAPPKPQEDLFRPQKPAAPILPGESGVSGPFGTPPAAEPQPPATPPEATSTTSRLLDAKRRAQKRKD